VTQRDGKIFPPTGKPRSDGRTNGSPVRRGHKEAFFKLLAQNPRSIDVVTLKNKNILHFAAEAGNLQVLDPSLRVVLTNLIALLVPELGGPLH